MGLTTFLWVGFALMPISQNLTPTSTSKQVADAPLQQKIQEMNPSTTMRVLLQVEPDPIAKPVPRSLAQINQQLEEFKKEHAKLFDKLQELAQQKLLDFDSPDPLNYNIVIFGRREGLRALIEWAQQRQYPIQIRDEPANASIPPGEIPPHLPLQPLQPLTPPLPNVNPNESPLLQTMVVFELEISSTEVLTRIFQGAFAVTVERWNGRSLRGRCNRDVFQQLQRAQLPVKIVSQSNMEESIPNASIPTPVPVSRTGPESDPNSAKLEDFKGLRPIR